MAPSAVPFELKAQDHLASLYMDKLDERLTPEEYSRARQKLSDRITRLDKDAEQAARRLGPTHEEIDQVWRQFGDFLRFSWPKLEPAEKRAVYEVLIKDITVYDKGHSPRLKVNWRE